MLEMYLKLHAARTVSTEPRGKLHGKLGRDEILAAGAHAGKLHPMGHEMVLAEDGDERAIKSLLAWAAGVLPELAEDLIAVALERPTSRQLTSLIKNHDPRYDRARRQAAKLNALATHAEKKGQITEAERYRQQARQVLADADAHSRRTIISTGKCPRCRGTGQAIRAVVGTCPACNGAGAVLPTMAHIKQRYGAEVASQFTRAVTALQVAQGEWIRAFRAQINREKEA